MKSEIRTFVAIKIQPEKEILNQLQSFKSIFRNDGIKWVTEENFHLTLRFIGNTTREQLYQLVDRFEIVAQHFNSFQIELKGSGYFRSKNHPRVLFVKVTESDELTALVKEVEKNVVASGFHEELKPFIPHFTLGRIKHLESRARFFTVVDELQEIQYHSAKVAEFILYQSILKPEGPTYKPIKSFKLV